MRLAARPRYRGLATLTGLACLATAVACGAGSPPELEGLTDQVAQVGMELQIELDGTSASGARLSYRYHAADLTDLDGHAEISISPSGAGVFRWTPLAADVGSHAFDFTVSDGHSDTTVTIDIDVRSAIGAATTPIFRQPLGTGTTIDLSQHDCVDLDVVIDDQDSSQVEIGQVEPAIDGATLTAVDGLSARWHWCPTRDQQAESRYTLVLSADDGDNPKTIKNYLIVLRGTDAASCPGAGPSITHTPEDETTRLDLTIDASVTDPSGLKDTPLFYYSLTDPGEDPDLSQMTQLSTLLITGDSTNGQYAADVPNPVASAADGTSATLYYVFAADDFDATQGCGHSAQTKVYHVTITAGGSGTAGACQPCSADAQCGAGNECVYMGTMGDAYCVQSCDAGCPTGYTCSSSPIWSIDGAETNQCVPESGSCQAPTGACQDDSWEINDARSDATYNPALAPDLYDLVSCPSATNDTRANDDWYKLVLDSDQRVDLQLVGDGATDLDLHLYQADGTVVSSSLSVTPNEEIDQCLPAATYYVKVDGYGHARSQYYLSYDSQAESCTAACVDDGSEPDDSSGQARVTTYPSYSSTGNTICSGNDDWYEVTLYTGETMTADLTFDQTSASQDLDLHLYQDAVDLWPCELDDPGQCSPDHGQSATSNEHATFTAPDTCDLGCTYDVVVRGWNGSTNTYDLAVGIQ
jgi:hypothetical protein